MVLNGRIRFACYMHRINATFVTDLSCHAWPEDPTGMVFFKTRAPRTLKVHAFYIQPLAIVFTDIEEQLDIKFQS